MSSIKRLLPTLPPRNKNKSDAARAGKPQLKETKSSAEKNDEQKNYIAQTGA